MAKPKAYNNDFARLLRQILKGKTDAWLADRIGKSRALVTHYRTGRALPPPETIVDICMVTGHMPLVFLEAAARAGGDMRFQIVTDQRAKTAALLASVWDTMTEAQELALAHQLLTFLP